MLCNQLFIESLFVGADCTRLFLQDSCMCSWQFTASRTISSPNGTTRNGRISLSCLAWAAWTRKLSFMAPGTNNISHNGSSRLLGNTGELGFHTRGWPPPACSRSGLMVLNLFWFHDFERIKKPFRTYDFQLLCHYSRTPREKYSALHFLNWRLFWESCCI